MQLIALRIRAFWEGRTPAVAWHMLMKNEPYRYAIPKATQEKLRKLRVQGTGRKYKTGPKKGSPKSVNYGTGKRTRSIPALAAVYEEEGLPELKPAAQGEQWVMERDAETAAFTRSLAAAQVEAKNKGVRARKQAASEGALSAAVS